MECQEFEDFEVERETKITFCLKELKVSLSVFLKVMLLSHFDLYNKLILKVKVTHDLCMISKNF